MVRVCESEVSSAVGKKMSEKSRYFESRAPLSESISRSIVTLNKMELFSIKSESIMEEKQDIEQPEEFTRGELRVETPSQGNIESLQAPQ